METIILYGPYLLISGCVFGFFMAWGIGANDVANAMGTSVGARALTLAQAILVACVFEFAGAYLAGGEVTSTIRKGIIDPNLLQDTPDLLVFGMLAALLAAGTWLLIASSRGWPVSTTHSIVGAIVGFAAVGISVDAVSWSKVGSIVSSWVVSPLMSGTIAFLIFISVQKLILNTDKPFENAKKYVPAYMFLQKLFACLLGLVVEAPGVEHVHAQPWGEQRVESAVVITVLHPTPRRALGQGDGTGEGVGIADGYRRSRELHHRLRGAPGEGSLGNRARVPGQVWTSAEWTRGRFLIFRGVSAPAERRRRFLCHRLAPDPP